MLTSKSAASSQVGIGHPQVEVTSPSTTTVVLKAFTSTDKLAPRR